MKYKRIDLERIENKLQSMNLRKVSYDTGIAYNTIREIAKGRGNPTLITLTILQGYIND